MTTAPLILVIGPQGSGKGTQVALLAEQFHIPAVGAGDLLRLAAAEPTEVGQRVKALIDIGHLVTIDLWEAVVANYIRTADRSRGLILEGVIRTMEQVQAFEQIRQDLKLPEPWVLSITLPDDVAVERLLKRGRVDDTEAGIRSRLTWSHSEVQPVIEYFRSRQRLVEVDGNNTIDAVHTAIVERLTAANAVPEAA